MDVTIYRVDPPVGAAVALPDYRRAVDIFWFSGVEQVPPLSKGDRVTLNDTRYLVQRVEWVIDNDEQPTSLSLAFYVVEEEA